MRQRFGILLLDKLRRAARRLRSSNGRQAMNDDELKGAEVDVDAERHPAPDDFDPTLTFGSAAIPREGGAGSAEIGPYRLVRRIGRGGMGEVWLAEQSTPVQRRVALKLIKAGMDTHEFVARFESERQALARMEHPAIARVFEAGSTVENHP